MSEDQKSAAGKREHKNRQKTPLVAGFYHRNSRLEPQHHVNPADYRTR